MRAGELAREPPLGQVAGSTAPSQDQGAGSTALDQDHGKLKRVAEKREELSPGRGSKRAKEAEKSSKDEPKNETKDQTHRSTVKLEEALERYKLKQETPEDVDFVGN